MTAYATSTDITKRYSSAELLLVADRDASGVADTDVVDTALSDASSEIDLYLGARYTVPLTSVPDTVIRMCVDIAMYRMAETAAALTDEKRKRYDDCIILLKAIASGDLTLGAQEPSTSASDTVSVSTDKRVWTLTLSDGCL